MKILFDGQKSHQEAAERRRWMCSTIRRLKTRGKSDSRCRELVAKHLPKGTGPKDRSEVKFFSELDAKKVEVLYKDDVSEKVRFINNHLHDMSDQRRSLQDSKKKIARLLHHQSASAWDGHVTPRHGGQRNNASTSATASAEGEDSSNAIDKPGVARTTSRRARPETTSGDGGAAKTIVTEAAGGLSTPEIEAFEIEELRILFAKSAVNGKLSPQGFGKVVESLRPGEPAAQEVETWWAEVRSLGSATLGDDQKNLAPAADASSPPRKLSNLMNPEDVLDSSHSDQRKSVQEVMHEMLIDPSKLPKAKKSSVSQQEANFESFLKWYSGSALRAEKGLQ